MLILKGLMGGAFRFIDKKQHARQTSNKLLRFFEVPDAGSNWRC